MSRRPDCFRHDMAQIPRIPTEVIRETLSHPASTINDELLRLPIYSEAMMSTIAQKVKQDAVQEMRQLIQRVYVYW